MCFTSLDWIFRVFTILGSEKRSLTSVTAKYSSVKNVNTHQFWILNPMSLTLVTQERVKTKLGQNLQNAGLSAMA